VRRNDLVHAPVDRLRRIDDSGGGRLDLVVDDELQHKPQASNAGSGHNELHCRSERMQAEWQHVIDLSQTHAVVSHTALTVYPYCAAYQQMSRHDDVRLERIPSRWVINKRNTFESVIDQQLAVHNQ
jgi:hypothetical protein